MSTSRQPDFETSEKRDRLMGEILNDILDRRARGEVVSEAELYKRHPSIADELSRYLRLLKNLRPVARTIDQLVDQRVLCVSEDSQYCATLGHYGILDVLGHGGMGIVLRAHDERLQRDVALKLLRSDVSGDDAAILRFSHEAKASASLRHPNIVTVYDVGDANGVHYFAMEYVDGPTLAGLIQERGPLESGLARTVFRQILAGLGAAHDAGIVHRDIKPTNILLLDGPDPQAKIADFGLARVLSAQTRLTMPDAVFGTPEYMSPEQARGDDHVDQRTDLYSAGVVLYEMLTGRAPFTADSPSAVVYKILHEDPPTPAKTNGNVDTCLTDLSMRLMAKRPEDRFESAEQAIAALDTGLHVRSIEKRRRFRRYVASAGLMVAAVFLAVSIWPSTQSPVSSVTNVPPPMRVIKSIDVPVNGARGYTVVLARFNDEGSPKVLYDKFPAGIQPQPPGRVLDPDGIADNGDELGVVYTEPAWNGDCLFAFDRPNHIKWRVSLAPKEPIAWPDFHAETRVWDGRCLDVGNLDSEPGDEVVLVANTDEYVARISIVKPDGDKARIVSTFWHLGQIDQVKIVQNFFDDGAPAILARGQNNKLDGLGDPSPRPYEPLAGEDHPLTDYNIVLVLMVLDPRRMNGVSSPRLPQLQHLGDAMPYAYAFLDHPYVEPNADEFGLVRWNDLSVAANRRDGTAPRLKIEIGIKDAQEAVLRGHGFLAELTDTLLMTSFIPTGPQGKGETYWRNAWTPIIQNGEYVGPIDYETPTSLP